MSLNFETIMMMPRWPERNWRILFVPYVASVRMPLWFYDLECNSILWILTHIWSINLNFETIMMPRWPERNWRILFVPYVASVWMPLWFYDLDCNSILWILTHIWYINLNFETIMMPRWPERNWRIVFVPYVASVWMPWWP